jgi:dihydropteroate synthase
MGVVNVTPDSFSDGGRFLDPEAALSQALKLIAEGADIIDVGGESTRPQAAPVSEAEELRRVLPVLEQLRGCVAVPISIDTMKPAVARAALERGASVVNDVAAQRQDPAMWRLVAEHGAGYVAMHMQGDPQTMQRQPTYEDVVTDVNEFFGDRLRQLSAHGVAPEQVVLDAGFGFGKTLAHNLQLLGAWAAFTKWQRPLMLGVSRKSFVGRVTGVNAAEARLAGSLACAVWAVARGANLVRTHDVAATRQALRMVEAILAHAAS